MFAEDPESVEPDWTEDSGDGVKYEEFYTKITQYAGADNTRKFISTYDGKLIYNVTKGLLFNTWDSTANTFLGTNW